jgi:sigma-B regulation protein RsbU (phosphoserine phosphatase)
MTTAGRSSTTLGSITLDTVTGPEPLSACIRPGRGLRLGRSTNADLVLLDGSVSRLHASIVDRGGRWFLTDEGSRHGTFLNGVQIPGGEAEPVAAGDQIRIGPWVFSVLIEGSGPPPMRIGGEQVSGGSTVHGAVATVVREHRRGEYVESLDEARLGRLAQSRLALLIKYAAKINTAPTEDKLFASVIEAVLAGSGFGRAALLRPKHTGASASEHGEQMDAPEVDVVAAASLGGRASDDDQFGLSASLITEAASGKPARLGGFGSSAGVPDYGQSVADLRIHTALCIPITVGEEIKSFLYLDARGGEATVQADAAEFCIALAQICGLAMASIVRGDLEARHRALEAQLGAAREAQQLIVPPPSGVVGGLKYALRMRPGMFVAGDLYDILELPDGRVAVFLGDVTGEGVGAGILMAGAQAQLHAAMLHHADPADAVNMVNHYLASHSPPDRFISLWVGIFDRAAGTVRYVDAGHGHWVHVCGTDGPRVVKGIGGIPAAIDPDVTYEAAEISFAPGDRLVLFSDGVVEQIGPEEVESDLDRPVSPTTATVVEGPPRFGITRVLDVLSRSETCDQDTRRLLRAVLDFAGREALDDDTTIASVEWAVTDPG